MLQMILDRLTAQMKTTRRRADEMLAAYLDGSKPVRWDEYLEARDEYQAADQALADLEDALGLL